MVLVSSKSDLTLQLLQANLIMSTKLTWLDQSKVLCTLPITVLVVIAALDSGDKALLGASFPMLEKTLGLHVDTLGYFSLFTNLSYALCLPLWGWLIHHYTVRYVVFDCLWYTLNIFCDLSSDTHSIHYHIPIGE